MPVLVNCPSCNGPLRVADDLLGRKVRCPACQTVFEAFDPGPTPKELPLEQERVDSWKHLDLELSRDPDPAPPPVPAPPPTPAPPPSTPVPPSGRRPGLFGAVEIDPGPQEPPRPRTPPSEERPAGPQRKQEEELVPCPSCRRMIHHDSTRCYACGTRMNQRGGSPGPARHREEEDDHDERFRRYGPRRDTEPHRGTAVLLLGVFSLVCLMGFMCYGVPNLLGAILGAIGWYLGHVDLKKMKEGKMDPDGHGQTQAGWVCSMLGAILNVLWTLTCWGGILAIVLIEMNSAQQRNNPGGFQAPPPRIQPKDKF